MERTVVCISAAEGAGGLEVAREVADRLGFRLVDEEVLQRAAAEAGVEPRVVADAERRRGLLERMMESLGSGGDLAAYAVVGVPPTVVDDPAHGDELREGIRTAVEELATEGRLVIFAHAASVALASRDDVLRVLVTAPLDDRRARVAASRSLDAKSAAKAVAEADRARAAYLKRFYDVDEETPALYDLVASTGRLGVGEVAALVAEATGAAGSGPAPA